MKAMISQPMIGLKDEDVKRTRNEIKDILEYKDYEVIDTLFQEDAPKNLEGDKIGTYFLGKSIMAMAEADVVVFTNGWKNSRGCVIEHEVAEQYGKIIIELNEENKF